MYKIELLPLAKNDLDNAVFYITYKFKNPIAAQKLISKFNECIKNVVQFPYGESIIYLDKNLSNEYRIARFNNYYIFYIVDEIENKIVITRIIYNKIDYYNMLE